jgi:hypothetical protein
MAAKGATAPDIAAKFETSVKTIEQKAKALGISIRCRRPVEVGLRAKGK